MENMWLMVSITTIMTMLAPLLIKYIEVVGNLLVNYVYDVLFGKTKHKGEIQVVHTTALSSDGQTSSENTVYKAILYRLSTNNLMFKCAKQIINTRVYYHLDKDISVVKKKLNLILLDTEPILLDEETQTFVLPSSEKITVGKDDSVCINNNILRIFSDSVSASKILDIISTYEQEYFTYLKKYIDTDIITFNKFQGYNDSLVKDGPDSKAVHVRTPIWVKRDFISNKSFDNTFFEGKDKVVNMIDEYINGRELYKRRGIAYNLSILLYGEPGCGKTSVIKSTAKKLKRHIIDINLGKITKCKDFEDVFGNEFIGDTYVPIDKRLIVLEDIDCMGDILHSRKTDTVEKINPINNMGTSLADSILTSMLKSACDEDKDNMNLSCFLNEIDGTYEHDNRVVIGTTNHIDKLDEAVLRRFDIKIHLSYLSQNIAQQLVDNYYNTKVLIPDISNDKYTGSSLTHLCRQYSSKNLYNVLKQNY